MSLVRLDVSDFDDTELGAEVRAAHAAGKNLVLLYDGSMADRRAVTWPDGHQGLYRLQCERSHVWLSALRRNAWVQPDCPTCDRVGEAVEDGLRTIS